MIDLGCDAARYVDVVADRRGERPGGARHRRRPRVHPLHVGLDGRAQGRDAHPSQRPHVRASGVPRRSARHPRIASRTMRRCTSTCRCSICIWRRSAAPRSFSSRNARRSSVRRSRISSTGSGSRSGTRCRRRFGCSPKPRSQDPLPRCARWSSPGEVYPTPALRELRAADPSRGSVEPLRPDRDQRVHLLQGRTPSAGRSDDPDRPSVLQHGGLRGGCRWRSSRRRTGGRAVRTGSHGDEGVLGPAGQVRGGPRSRPPRRISPTSCIGQGISLSSNPMASTTSSAGVIIRSRAAAIGSNSGTSSRHSSRTPIWMSRRSSPCRTTNGGPRSWRG